MKTPSKTIAIVLLLLIAGFKGYSQTTIQKADSVQMKVQQEQTSVEADDQTAKGNVNAQANGNNNAAGKVKQVRGRRPDMSKARGARPPMIVRPSGSGIPKGAGKPGGVGRKGGR
jgi:hypothetical protein